MMEGDFELVDSAKPRVESEPIVDGSSIENRVDSAPVHSIGPSDNSAVVQGVGRSVAEGSIESVSAEGNVSDVNSRKAGDLIELSVISQEKEAVSDRNRGSVKSEQQKGQRRKESKSKESRSPVYDSMISMFDEFASSGTMATEDRSSMEVSPVHGFEVGDMVWGKVKSHPWWPGHVYNEEFANPSVRRSKRDGLLLVAFFGDSSYGWFDPSELIPFDSNFAEKYRQTNSKTFVKAVEEAMDEVSRRSALGLSCMCRSKQNFRETDVKGYFAVDVPDYEPGAVYSIDAIEKARDIFKPSSALDFVRQLALEPSGCEPADIDFIKNKANVICYRRAVYEEFDETYAQAFGYSDAPVRSSSGSIQESAPRKTPYKAPLSGRQVFADTSGKGKSSAKSNRPKDHAKKDKYLLKRRDESNEVKTPQKEKEKVTFSPQIGPIDDDEAVPTGEYVLQRRALPTHDELTSKDSSVIMEFGDQTIKSKVDDDDDKGITEQMDDKKSNSDLADDKKEFTQSDTPNPGPHKTVSSQSVDNEGAKKVKVSKRPIVDVGSGKSVLPEKKKKRRKEQSMSDGVPLVIKGKISAKKPIQSAEDPHVTDNKPTISSAQLKETKTTALASHETELPRVLSDLHSLALDPFRAINKGRLVKTRQAFLRYRSIVFQKSLNLSPPSATAAEDDGNDTHSSINNKLPENGGGVTPVKPQPVSSRGADDPTKGGRKRGPSDRQEEMAAKKKIKVRDIKNLTKDKKVIKRIDETPTRDVKQGVAMTLKKPGPNLTRNAELRVEPTMLIIKFPQGGNLPSISELKAKFARFGQLDHSYTRVNWKTLACRLVFKHKLHARMAHKFVVESSNLFGNTNLICSLKEMGVVEPDASAAKVPKGEHQAAGMEDRPTSATASGVQLKSILKKSGGEEAAAAAGNGGRGRVKFMLGGEESEMKNTENQKKNGVGASSFSSSSTIHSTMDFNSKNFQKTVSSSSHPLPLSTSSAVTSSTTTQFTRPPPNSMHYGGAPQSLPPPPPFPPPRSLVYGGGEMASSKGNFVHKLERPNMGAPATPKVDISQQFLSLLLKCNEVVTNVTNTLGYVPYHPL